ncbi:MAG: FecR family protein [Planctomycetota bacterium]
MSALTHDDLVAYAFGGLDERETERIRSALEESAQSAAELAEIRRHLDLHDQVAEIQPAPALWANIRDRLDEPAPRSFLQRHWMPIAAAALVLVALLVSRLNEAEVRYLHGAIERKGSKTFTSTGVARLQMGDGVVLTLDDATTITSLDPQRLALNKAGRVFLVVSKESRRGFTVEAGDLEITTTGTAFLVEWLESGERRVWTESGSVRCRRGGRALEVAAGNRLRSADGPVESYGTENPRAFFQQPTLEARILAPDTIRVVVRNEMPDGLRLAPPTGGEPFFYASYPGRDLPLDTADVFGAPIRLQPMAERSFDLRLPHPLPVGAVLVVSCPSLNARVEAVR